MPNNKKHLTYFFSLPNATCAGYATEAEHTLYRALCCSGLKALFAEKKTVIAAVHATLRSHSVAVQTEASTPLCAFGTREARVLRRLQRWQYWVLPPTRTTCL